MILLANYPFEAAGPFLSALSLVFLLVFLLLGLAITVYLAALPGRIATRRGHPHADAVRVAGWLGLPTGMLWVLAMVWAYWCENGSVSGEATSSLLAGVERLELSVARLEVNMEGGE